MRRATTNLMVGLAAVLTLAGCASGGEEQPTDEGLTWEDSPLAEYMGDAGQMEEYEALEVEVQEAIAACMAEEGFEYVPAPMDFDAVEVDDEDYDTEEWVAANGYGLSGSGEEVDESELPDDPNLEYVESLSPSEQEAYYATLYGPTPSEEELSEDGSYEYDWRTAGCQGAADHEIRGDLFGDEAEHQELFDAIEELYAAQQDDPQVAELDAEWSECMADAGQPGIESPGAAFEQAMEASNALWEDPESEPTDAEQAAVRDAEIETALADFRCKADIDYDDRTLAVQFAMEEQFIEDHREELEAYRASVEQGS